MSFNEISERTSSAASPAVILQERMAEAHLTNTVLIVDTNKHVVGALAAELKDAGYIPSGVNSYNDAGRRLEAGSPDVMVVSVELGAYNGLQLAMRCAASHPTTRVIVVGPPSAALEHDACELGASVYMPRPLTAGALTHRLKTLALAEQHGSA